MDGHFLAEDHGNIVSRHSVRMEDCSEIFCMHVLLYMQYITAYHIYIKIWHFCISLNIALIHLSVTMVTRLPIDD